MKLNPITIIAFEDYLDKYEHIIVGQKENTFIYLNDKNDLKIYNKEEILKNESIEHVDFLKDNGKVVSIIKTNNNYKVIIDDIEYEITKLFKFYLTESLSKKTLLYHLGIKALENNDIVTFIKDSISVNTFINLYKEYIIFKDNLKRLFKAGFSYEYFMYLHQKGLDSVIINMANKLELNKISEPEIDILNELGRSYVKK